MAPTGAIDPAALGPRAVPGPPTAPLAAGSDVFPVALSRSQQPLGSDWPRVRFRAGGRAVAVLSVATGSVTPRRPGLAALLTTGTITCNGQRTPLP